MCALSSACLASCWSVVFGSQHSCLEFQFHVGVWTLALHVQSCCVSMRSRVHSAVRSSVHVRCVLCSTRFVFGHMLFLSSCVVARSSCFYRLRAFMLCLLLCCTQLVFFIGCVLSCCHVLCEHASYEYSH